MSAPPIPPTARSSLTSRWSICALTAASCFLHIYNIGKEGFANPYYAVAVRSMLGGGRLFFYLAFDPLGFVSVDKPPLALWLQTASAWILGFQGWALILPQAIAGALCVPVLYAILRRGFSVGIALMGAALLALTPILIAASRSNVFDSLLLLALLCAAYATLRATETGSWQWLLQAGIWIGLGFNIKMLEAFLALPALALVYLCCAQTSPAKRLAHLGVMAMAVALLALAWPLAVDATPAAQRPFVGGTTANREMELIIGHNGLERLGWKTGANAGSLESNPAGIEMEIGTPGWMRLTSQPLGGQASWLLPLALIGLTAWFWLARKPENAAARRQTLLWGAWLLTGLVFFSFAGFFHRYYLVLLAPPVAALAAATVGLLRAAAARGERVGWLLPPALMCTVLFQVWMLAHQLSWNDWIAPLALALATLASLALIPYLFAHRTAGRAAGAILFGGMMALMIAPTAWALTPIIGANDAWVPFAGPELLTAQPEVDLQPLLDFANAHRSGEAWLLAVYDGRNAAPLMLHSNQPVMALGGFDGEDPILPLDTLRANIGEAQLRYLLYPDRPDSVNDISTFLAGQCRRVPANEWGGQVAYPRRWNWALWDCRPHR
jgi:4-amino-4-deoxy-L-arabinose transferase-like glycosyltransferase